MFFYTANFTSAALFPSVFPAIEIVLEFLPWRNEVKNARQMQSRWLVASPFCNDQFLHAVACKRAYFLRQIARSNNTKSIFFVLSQGRKWLAAIAICKLSIARSNGKEGHVFMSYHDKQVTRTTLFTSYCKGASNARDLYTSRGSKHTSGRQKSTIKRMQGTVFRVWQWWSTMQKSNILYAVERKKQQQRACIMSYCKRSNNNYIFDVAKWTYC